MKPNAPACERNKDSILASLRQYFAHSRSVLEIGSGTGQHAVHFAANMPWLQWYTSDLPDSHAGINAWVADAGLSNCHPPIELDVSQSTWPLPAGIDAVFSANSLHIMGRDCVEGFFSGVGKCLPAKGMLCVYGPFNYNGTYTSDSNAAFDVWLKERDVRSAIRDFEWVNQLAGEAGLTLMADQAMPANNRLLSWQHRPV